VSTNLKFSTVEPTAKASFGLGLLKTVRANIIEKNKGGDRRNCHKNCRAKKLNLFIFCIIPHLIFAGIEFQQFIAVINNQ
jgi:hypothetical protein